MTDAHRFHRRLLGVATVVLVLGAGFFAVLVKGASVAARRPSAVEASLSTWVLRQSVPDADRDRASPLGVHPAQSVPAAGWLGLQSESLWQDTV